MQRENRIQRDGVALDRMGVMIAGTSAKLYKLSVAKGDESKHLKVGQVAFASKREQDVEER